jgi:hypothetical protein
MGPVAAACFLVAILISYAAGLRGFTLFLIVPVLTLIVHIILTVVIGFIVPPKVVLDNSGPVSLRLK